MVKLDIQLLNTYDLGTIGFVDISNYGNTVINAPTFEITVPGFNKKTVLFTPKQANVFDAVDLGISCDGGILPDGLYIIKYSITNNFVEKQFYNTKNIILRYQKLVLNLLSDSFCNCISSKVDSQLSQISLLIEGTEAAANNCNWQLAYKYYEKANTIIKRLQKCNC